MTSPSRASRASCLYCILGGKVAGAGENSALHDFISSYRRVKKWSGLTPAPWLPQETNCHHTFGAVVQKQPETSVRQLEQRGGRRWCIWHCRSDDQLNSRVTCLQPSRKALTGGCVAAHDGVSSALLSPGPPIVSEEELSCLSLISPASTSQYSGSRVRALIQILQHQMDQQELVKEFMVRVCLCVCTVG